MGITTKVIIVFAIAIGVLVLLAGGQWLRAALLVQRFDRYIHVRIDIPRCSRTISDQPTCCVCVAAFEGKRSPSDIKFIGNDLSYKYDEQERTYLVSGNGIITDGKNTIELRKGRILLNGRDVPDASIPIRVLLTEAGDLQNMYFH